MTVTYPVYFDYAATAPLCREAVEALLPYVQEGLTPGYIDANANTLYTLGRTSFKALDQARRDVATAIHGRPDEIIFTSGATEADNAAIMGIAIGAANARHIIEQGRKPQVITCVIEHDAVYNPVKRLERMGYDVVRLPIDRRGFVSPEALEAAMTSDCVLVSIQMANGEIGMVQPVAQLAAIAHKGGALFHTDATQAIGKLPFDAAALGIDAASISSHKVGGPKGVGVLYLKSRTPFDPLVLGGGQESGRRSGTQNVAGAVGCAAAIKAAVASQAEEAPRLIALRDRAYAGLTAFKRVHATAPVEPCSTEYLPHVINLHVDGLEGPTMVLQFDNLGFCVSGGSACSSGSLDPSRAMLAMGLKRDEALGELRLSIGRYTTAEEIDAFLAVVPQVLEANHGR